MVKYSIYTTALVLAFICVDYTQAQNQKIGFIDSDIIMEQMPEYSGIEQQLELLSEGWEEEIRELELELQELEQDFEAREILFTDEIRRQRLDEISLKRDNLDQLTEEKFGPQGEYFTRQAELLEPVQRKIFDALNEVANRGSFDFVFDRAGEIRFLFTNNEWNLTEEVLSELGMNPAGN
ncbi:MAG: OmpH family outer membrane protein [Balneolaceae bacterium]